MALLSEFGPDYVLALLRVDLHQVHTDQLAFIDDSADYVAGLTVAEPIAIDGSGLRCLIRVDYIEVEGDMEWRVFLRVQILQGLGHHLPNPEFDNMVHAISLHFMFMDGDILIVVNVPDSDHDQILKGQLLLHPLEARQFMHPSNMGQGHAMIVLAGRVLEIGVDKVRMGIDPQNFQIRVGTERSIDGRRAQRMIPADCEDNVAIFSIVVKVSQFDIQGFQQRIQHMQVVNHMLHRLSLLI